MTRNLLIYGATGFTGRLITEEALAFGLRPVLAGRSRQSLGAMAKAEGLEHRLAPVDDPSALARLLEGVEVVLNAAGPFRATSVPLAQACLEQGVHYLDISGEISTFEAVRALDDEAQRRNVMLMPGVGFDVVPTDCMAAWIAERLPSAKRLSIGLAGLDAISRGSALSVLEQYDELVTIRRRGALTRVTPGELECDFDFGRGPIRAAAITWADVVTAYHSTGIQDIVVYHEATPIVRLGLNVSRNLAWVFALPAAKLWLKAGVGMLPDGPDRMRRSRGRAVVVVRASDDHGRSAEVRLETPEVYSFTATSSVAIADRVLHGELTPGFQTPARVYGPGLVLSLPGVRQTILQ